MSLLTIPAEVRLRIYGYLFASSILEVTEGSESEQPQPEIFATVSYGQVPIQVTSTCRLLRQESTPALLSSTLLVYKASENQDSSSGYPAFQVLPQHVLSQIRDLRILVTNSKSDFPFDSMPSLQRLRAQYRGVTGPLRMFVTHEDIKGWVDFVDETGMVKLVKRSLREEAPKRCEQPPLGGLIENTGRTCSIEWTDLVTICLAEDTRFRATMWLSFDWDQEKVLGKNNENQWLQKMQTIPTEYSRRAEDKPEDEPEIIYGLGPEIIYGAAASDDESS